MDLQTLIIVVILANALQASALFGLYRVGRIASGPGWWVLGSISITLGFVMHALRQVPAIEHSAIVGNNLMFFAGLALLYVGVMRFFGKRERRSRLLLFGLFFTLLIVQFTYINNDLDTRRMVISLTVALFSFLIARALLVHKTPSVVESSRFLAIVFLAYGAFFLLRAFSVVVDNHLPEAFASSATQSATYLVTLVFSTLWTFGLIILVNQGLNAEGREARDRFESIFTTSPDAVLITRLSDGCFVDINEGFTALTGYVRNEVLGKTSTELDLWCNPSDRLKVFNAVSADGFCENLESAFRHKNGGQIFGSLSAKIVNLQGIPHIISVTRDISANKQAKEQLEESNRKLEALSITDGLTGLANRRHFDEVLAKEYARHIRTGAELSLIMLDIDHFKAFNDCYGHVSGDECLRQIGRAIAEGASRAADLAARYGGEEFACILPETDRAGAVVIAEQIRRGIQALAIPHRGSAVAECVTASLGLATVICSADQAVEELITRSDEMLYLAKSNGRNRVEFISGEAIKAAFAGESQGGFVQLAWKESFCCGNELIDSQHQALFRDSNALLKATLARKPAEEVAALIKQLFDDVAQHFQDEQLVLESIGFPGIIQHVEEHNKLLNRGGELAEHFSAGNLSVGDVFQFLAYDVVMVHMFGADREYFDYLPDGDSGRS